MSITICSELAETEWQKIVNFTRGIQRMGKKYKQRLAQLFEERTEVSVGYLKIQDSVLISDIKKVIGKNGYWLKMTTRQQNLYFSWYDKTNRTVIFWGKNMLNVWNGIKVIEKRLKQHNSVEQAQVHQRQAQAYAQRSRSVTPPVYFHPITFGGYEDTRGKSDATSVRSKSYARSESDADANADYK